MTFFRIFFRTLAMILAMILVRIRIGAFIGIRPVLDWLGRDLGTTLLGCDRSGNRRNKTDRRDGNLVPIRIIVIAQKNRVLDFQSGVFVGAQCLGPQDRRIVATVQIEVIIVEHHFFDIAQGILAGQLPRNDDSAVVVGMPCAIVVVRTKSRLQDGNVIVAHRSLNDNGIKPLFAINQIIALRPQDGFVAGTAADLGDVNQPGHTGQIQHAVLVDANIAAFAVDLFDTVQDSARQIQILPFATAIGAIAQNVKSGTALDGVASRVRFIDLKDIIAFAPIQPIVPGPADNRVVAGAAKDHIVALVAFDAVAVF